MAATMGVAVALGRTPPPAAPAPEPTRIEALVGYAVDEPLTVAGLLTQSRFDLVFGTLALVLAGLYVAGVRRLRARGDAWPVGPHPLLARGLPRPADRHVLGHRSLRAGDVQRAHGPAHDPQHAGPDPAGARRPGDVAAAGPAPGGRRGTSGSPRVGARRGPLAGRAAAHPAAGGPGAVRRQLLRPVLLGAVRRRAGVPLGPHRDEHPLPARRPDLLLADRRHRPQPPAAAPHRAPRPALRRHPAARLLRHRGDELRRR